MEPQKEHGVIVTLRDIYDSVGRIENKMDDELGKLKTQVAAQWVIHGILVAVLINIISRSL